MRTRMLVDISIVDKEKLLAFGQIRADADADHSDENELVVDAIVDSASPPLQYGCEIVSRSMTDTSGTGRRIELVVDVVDADRLVAEARRVYAIAWNDADWQPETLCEAVYETMIASNQNPAPLEIGFEIVNSSFMDDEPVASSAPSI